MQKQYVNDSKLEQLALYAYLTHLIFTATL